ncbi:hypothetical protein EVAR_34696_1 [Eumeta japonica]|uniref:RNase H type-1 domain-containing protein n=1 Tax=Eumeta variegata TaxID=151549 RepID=A0A4C1XC33_EUMVA|nr:hypothetical protein EVAR_34696_1 [Eumeta japonica]
MGNTFVDQKHEKPLYFGDLSHRGDGRAGKAIRRTKNGKDGLFNIFSNSSSFLEVLSASKTYHPLVHEVRRDISEIVAEGRAVRLFWVSRAHTGIAGNEPAGELAKRAALTKKTEVDYDWFPLSRSKKMAQTRTGHGGFAQYLFRFELRHSPHCACDPAKIQDVLHVLKDCDVFLREHAALEAEIDVHIVRRNFPEIMEETFKMKRENRYNESENKPTRAVVAMPQ